MIDMILKEIAIILSLVGVYALIAWFTLTYCSPCRARLRRKDIKEIEAYVKEQMAGLDAEIARRVAE